MVLLLAGLGMGKDTVGKLDEYCVVLQPPALAGCDRPKMASLDRAVFDNCRAHELTFISSTSVLRSHRWLSTPSMLVCSGALCMRYTLYLLKVMETTPGCLIWLAIF